MQLGKNHTLEGGAVGLRSRVMRNPQDSDVYGQQLVLIPEAIEAYLTEEP
jgi:hypothetical protein